MKTKTIRSPLGYLGGKRWLYTRFIENFLPDNIDTIISPFFGGGALEINLAAHKNITVYGYDICPFLVNFWQHWLYDSQIIRIYAYNALAIDNIKTLKDVKVKEFQNDKEYNYLNQHPFKHAVYYYIFNKLSFGGLGITRKHVLKYKFKPEQDDFYRFHSKQGYNSKVISIHE